MSQTLRPAREDARVRPDIGAPEVLFLAPGDVSKGRVEPISWMRSCEAYARHGARVTLVTLRVRRPDAVESHSVWSHFGLAPSFRLVAVPTPLRHDSPVLWFRLCAGLPAFALALRTLARQALRPRALVVHARAPVLAAPFVLVGRLLPARRRPELVLETHALPKAAHGWIVRGADLVVVNSRKLALDVASAFDVPPERVLFAPLGPYNEIRRGDRLSARSEIGLPHDAAVACYAGKMTREHNEFLLGAAAALVGRIPHFRLLLVGGNPAILAWTRRRVAELGLEDTVVLTGFVAPARVDLHLAAADVLVYHMPSSLAIFPYCTPAKGYEYQAAGRPIVATDFPLFDEVFGADGERALRVAERTPEALATGLQQAFSLQDGGGAMAERAAAWVEERTWERRCELILRALGF